jgi:hypothetical protein
MTKSFLAMDSSTNRLDGMLCSILASISLLADEYDMEMVDWQMALVAASNRGEIKDISVQVIVPNDPEAKFYMQCVNSCLDLDDPDDPTIRRLSDYSQYSSLQRGDRYGG